MKSFFKEYICVDKFRCVFLVLLIIFSRVFILTGSSLEGSTAEQGELLVDNKLFKYEKNCNFINIYNSKNKLVFSYICEEENTIILNFGFSEIYNSFYIFKEKFDPDPVNFKLSIGFENFNIPVINSSASAFYTPVLVEDIVSYVIYISEDSSIVLYDLEKKMELKKIKSKTPIMKLSKNTIDNREIIEFYKFVQGKYKKYFFNIKDIGTGKINFLTGDLKDDKSQESNYYKDVEEKESIISIMPISLDYKKFIGFGDSITYGKINREEAPEKGYIPRLQPLLDEQLYEESEVINAGEPELSTYEVVEKIEEKFDGIILEHKGKYLLFHLGTIDVVHPARISISQSVFNIEYIIKKALEYNLQPILTTLIPRNEGIHEELYRYRGELLSDGIKELAESLSIPLIDFWDIFLNYPESEGGYFSLMSDNVHPSEVGYQLMAEEWLRALLDLPPMVPGNITFFDRSRYEITVQWLESPELDLSHYYLKFGFSPDMLNRAVTLTTANYTFIYFPLHYPFFSKIYFQIQAIDNGGNGSEFTSIQEVEFNL